MVFVSDEDSLLRSAVLRAARSPKSTDEILDELNSECGTVSPRAIRRAVLAVMIDTADYDVETASTLHKLAFETLTDAVADH